MADNNQSTRPQGTWTGLIPIALIVAVGLSALLYVTLGNSARFNDSWLTSSADHIRTQMDGSPTEQITRAAIPPRNSNITYRGWTNHDDTQWAMCLNTGEVDDDNETRHLIFTATGPYRIRNGACPAIRTLTAPE